ncbi:MAG: hypothetical protein N3B15_08430 [Planctomycetota bacterium]|nr:hypothetical protein [Planctomycetota bacterium]
MQSRLPLLSVDYKSRMRRILYSLFAACLLLSSCSDPPRFIVLHYAKPDVSESQAYKDKERISKVSGVHNVILEYDRDGTARLQVFVEEGKVGNALEFVESLGYSRQR